ncbi:amidohydrolase family protein [Actinomadura madurae]|uniref:amidohydrolase family protein n=1 Tax=Actinomadura madurae TaxID=1993 RepID=UPI00202764B0|nr:amidohydrolase family protein [Actinomadura madurae]URM96453.1 amidohydrolase family protein [Actinomadura madurae]
MSELLVVRNAHVFAPEDLGVRDILCAGGRIAALEPDLDVGALAAPEIDAAGMRVIPGMVDGHVHVIGGGGAEGYGSRIPELWAGELAAAGITTVVAPPGLDMVTKNLEGLLAKIYALESEGLTAYMMTGGFQRPFRTITGSLRRDIYTIEKIIGVKIALGETRASRFRRRELVELAAQLHWLSGFTGKACLMHAHLGEAEHPAAQLVHTMRRSGVPPHRFQATHCNFTPDTMQAAEEVARHGGFVDFNPILTPEFGHPHAVPVVQAVLRSLDAGIDDRLVTLTTDGNASVPMLLEDGTRGAYEKSLTWLWSAVVELVREGMPLSRALSFVTANPARALGLEARKGRVRVGADADLVVIGSDMEIEHVIARGRHLVDRGRPTVMSLYEPGRRPAGGGPGTPTAAA